MDSPVVAEPPLGPRAADRLLERAPAVRRLYPDEYVFLLAHMRSYSSLLGHVLGESPEISGYAESQLKYRRRSDLLRLRLRVACSLGGWPRGRYLLDKQLHDHQQLPRRWQRLKAFRALVFVREPAATLASIRRLHGMVGQPAWYGDWDAVARYYCSRLATLASHGATLGARALVFRAEEIVARRRPLLERIAEHLELARAPCGVYMPRRWTGDGRHGDPSAAIRAGRIVTPLEPPSPAPPARVLERCVRAHARALAALADWCPVHGAAAAPPLAAPRAEPGTARAPAPRCARG